MNELASAASLNLAWVFGILLGVLSVLVGVIWRNLERRLHKIEESFVSKETLDRVERTWRDDIYDMTQQRREQHQENKAALAEIKTEIKDGLNGVHERIDAEFRAMRKREPHH